MNVSLSQVRSKNPKQEQGSIFVTVVSQCVLSTSSVIGLDWIELDWIKLDWKHQVTICETLANKF
jgi:hypothetical protein